MNKSALTRLGRLERGRDGPPEFWQSLGDGQVQNMSSGAVVHESALGPSGSFTFEVERARLDADA